MTRVFEALQRKQDRRNNEESRDPLAAETGAPEDEPDSEAARTEFELPSVIGSPVPSRLNEGANEKKIAPASDPGAGDEPGRSPITSDRHPPTIGSPVNGSINARARGQRDNNSASGNAFNETAPPDQPPLNDSAQAEGNRAASRVVEDIRRRQAETQKLREEASYQAVARASREIPVERLNVSRLHQRLIILTEPTAPECEQYRTLRTQLFHAAEKRQTQVVVITSALAGEGKTSTALNLALAVAQSKESRVLVMDGDLRRPNIATYLGMRPKVGLSEVLRGEIEALDSIVCLEEPELYALPVKREAQNPTELLSSERLTETFRELRDYFDFILVDSPPVMPFADSRLLANHSDAVILVVRAEKAPYETVEKAVEALPGGRILGVVLNGAEHIGETDYYEYYYSYTQRERRRGALLGKLTSRVRQSWLGRKMKL